ncbi:MAG: BsuBI/PstI family type II restriction endonuclease [Trueperaceae bacterium]
MLKNTTSKFQSGFQHSLIDFADLIRLDSARHLSKEKQTNLGQFFTPPIVASRLAKLFIADFRDIHLLDAGAGVGTLTAAFIETICNRENRPKSISVTAYEIDENLLGALEQTLKACHVTCEFANIDFSYNIVTKDFLEDAANILQRDLFANIKDYNCAILNPPYKKMSSESKERHLLQSIGVDTGNLYTAFLALASKLLESGGELVTITPRSFCNGAYFKPFRQTFLKDMTIFDIESFENRSGVFDDVLQENILLHTIKFAIKPEKVKIVFVEDLKDSIATEDYTTYDEVVHPNDEEHFIHIVSGEMAKQAATLGNQLTHSLKDLGIAISTGRVVDFRATEALRQYSDKDTAPLIYPFNLKEGYISWPISKNSKPQAIVVNEKTASLLVATGFYVLLKRFSAKEEKRRIVASLFNPDMIQTSVIGFENHLNYFHMNGFGLPEVLARGLTIFLNSTLFDECFRRFSGNTQVNATDLRNLKYPSREQLEILGQHLDSTLPDQETIDKIVTMTLFPNDDSFKSLQGKSKIEEALVVLAALGLPKAQLNDRSALTLLALLNLAPGTPWEEASSPLIGITPIMNFMADHYGKNYQPNTRETIRRQTMHQFVDAGIAVPNPDNPKRPPNSPKWVYQIELTALTLLRTYGTSEWEKNLKIFLESVGTLREKYAQARQMERIPVTFNENVKITLSPGGQNELVEKIIHEFCPRFVPGGRVIYLGDTDEKLLYFDEEQVKNLGVIVGERGKMPDVVIYDATKNWLLLIEAVTSHGPINPKRLNELAKLFEGTTAGLVYVTTFLTRKAMLTYLNEIAWETEVWVAESPGHMIHFDGKRFLGPY